MDTGFAPPETRYALSGDTHIAYQVVGDGPRDIVFVMGWVSHLDYFWKEPGFARFLRRLASFSRLILFDKRGTGLSDRVAGLPMLEERMDDVRAVMDTVGSERAALVGISEGGTLCALFAATYPERTTALIELGGYARRLEAPDYPWGWSREQWLNLIDHVERDWGNDIHLDVRAPSAAGDPQFRAWWTTYLRMSASPGAAATLTRMNMDIDIRSILPTIRVPTLIVQRVGDRAVTVGNGRYLTEHIPGARYVELPGDDHLPFVGDQDAILDEIERFLTGRKPVPHPEPERVLATLLFTEIVGAAALAARLPADAWRRTVAAHDAVVRDHLARFRGREVSHSRSGLLAVFDGPGRAIHCASAIVAEAERRGLSVRAGLHTGECTTAGDHLEGVAVQIAAQALARAGPGEVLLTHTVKDLVAGSPFVFADVGSRLVSGPGTGWRLYRVAAAQRDAGPITAETTVEEHGRGLSRRENEVAALIARGLSNREIASELSISIGTAERHVANIFAKLGFHSRAQVAAYAIRNGLA